MLNAVKFTKRVKRDEGCLLTGFLLIKLISCGSQTNRDHWLLYNAGLFTQNGIQRRAQVLPNALRVKKASKA